MKLPDHKCALHLVHNDHKNVYEDVEDWIYDNDVYHWKDEESKRRAIQTNSVWTLQWYPETPIGFCAVAAPTLEELIEFANS
jgi:hypothetical protein